MVKYCRMVCISTVYHESSSSSYSTYSILSVCNNRAVGRLEYFHGCCSCWLVSHSVWCGLISFSCLCHGAHNVLWQYCISSGTANNLLLTWSRFRTTQWRRLYRHVVFDDRRLMNSIRATWIGLPTLLWLSQARLAQSCPWLHFRSPDPTQPINRVTKPNPIQLTAKLSAVNGLPL